MFGPPAALDPREFATIRFAATRRDEDLARIRDGPELKALLGG